MSSAKAQVSDNPIQTEDGLDQYLTFFLADEEYGVDILRVQEIKGWEGVTPMPNMPSFVLGVINLRGTVVPIVNLRILFGMDSPTFDKTTVVIVVRVRDAESNSERTVGMVVDAVSEVHNIAGADVRPAPDYSGACRAEYIRGLAIQDDSMLILLEVDRLVNEGVLGNLESDGESREIATSI